MNKTIAVKRLYKDIHTDRILQINNDVEEIKIYLFAGIYKL